MELVAHKISHPVKTKVSTSKKESSRLFWERMDFNRFGIAAWTLAVVSCLSGIVAGFFVDGSSQWQLTLVIAPMMLTLCMILAVAPIKTILGVGVMAVLVDLVVMIVSSLL